LSDNTKDTVLASMIVDGRISLDGERVSELINPVFEQGVALLVFVDNWMRGNFS
jgi:hypothetical protein